MLKKSIRRRIRPARTGFGSLAALLLCGLALAPVPARAGEEGAGDGESGPDKDQERAERKEERKAERREEQEARKEEKGDGEGEPGKGNKEPRPEPRADATAESGKALWKVPVLVLCYFPVTQDKEKIDIKVTSNVDAPLAQIQEKCRKMTREAMDALEQGSRFRAYKNPAIEPSLDYILVDYKEFLEPTPRGKKDGTTWKPDYRKMLDRVDVRSYVEEKGVKEVWIFSYHSSNLSPWESNMASQHGDISNSDRDQKDLPVFKKTYTVYNYNYQRNTEEAVHNHIHQIEALMGASGKDLWRLFVGKKGAWRCGNCHFPPNARKDYDYRNKETVMSDIEDWRPESRGEMKPINCERWDNKELNWYIFWMQSMPGEGNGLTYKGKTLTNWWSFFGDYDAVVRNKIGMTGKDLARSRGASRPSGSGGDSPDEKTDPPPEDPPAPETKEAPPPLDEGQVAEAAKKGREALDVGDYTAAANALSAIPDHSPDRPVSEDFQSVRKKIADRSTEEYVAAKRLRESGKLKEALQAFETVIAAYPGFPASARSKVRIDEIKADPAYKP